jgi:hypothetical protein
MLKIEGKRAQLTVFIIIAIVLVATMGLYYAYKTKLFETSVPKEFESVYSYYLSCVQEETLNGALLLGSQAGYIQKPEFSPGSEYMPFSSQLNFLGTGIPYWYYISGNNIVKEQVPTKEKMQEQLNDYLQEEISNCDFSQFEEQGFSINFNVPVVKTTINTDSIAVSIDNDLNIEFENKTFRKTSHSTSIVSNLGRFYDTAKKIYQNQKDSMFLENYGLDILRLYAPVDGSEIGCAPKIWFVDKIRQDLTNALEVNVPEVKIKGDYYTLSNPDNKYFVKDLGQDIKNLNVNFVYNNQWPSKLEVWPSENGLLRADPVGLQEGLGMLGFCYTPYHFVYDFAYPVLIQLSSGNEIFQFPLVVYINKNNPREALDTEGLPDVVPELCDHKNTLVNVKTSNIQLDPVEADIKFKCFDTTCSIGNTSIDETGDAMLTAEFPQCANGYIIASAEGYKTKKYILTTVSETDADILLDKTYELNLSVLKNNNALESDYALISFESNNETTTVSYPEQKQVELTEGQYDVQAYVYSNASRSVKGSSTQKCVDVPKSGVLGIFGTTEKKCFTLNIPDQIASFAISGGGEQSTYLTQSELESSKNIVINVQDFGIPTTVEKLQDNYNKVETSYVDINLN